MLHPPMPLPWSSKFLPAGRSLVAAQKARVDQQDAALAAPNRTAGNALNVSRTPGLQ